MEWERGKKKGEKAAKNMFSLLAGEVEIGKGTKEGQLDNSVAKSWYTATGLNLSILSQGLEDNSWPNFVSST